MGIIRKSINHTIGDREKDVILNVEIGDGQGPGDLTVRSGNVNESGSSLNVNLGKGADLVGTISAITGPVNMSNGKSDFASLEIKLTNETLNTSARGKGGGDSAATFIVKIEHK